MFPIVTTAVLKRKGQNMKKVVAVLFALTFIMCACGNSSDGSPASNEPVQTDVSEQQEGAEEVTVESGDETVAEEETAVTSDTGVWKKAKVVDDFGDEVEDADHVVYAPCQGTFSNTATEDSDLLACAYIRSLPNEYMISFRLYEYNDHKASFISSEAENIELKTKIDGEVKDDYKILAVEPNSDLFIEGKSECYDLVKALRDGSDVKCVINIGNSKYNFIIPSEGFIEILGYIDIYGEEYTEYQKDKQEAADNSIDDSDELILGKYEQDNNSDNGKEDIEWIVLDEKEGKKLIISKYALATHCFNSETTDVTWEECTLREWLNNDFLNEAFSDTEKTRIEKTTVVNDDVKLSSSWTSTGGNDTEDQIFLLSYDEFMSYFNEDMICTATPFALEGDPDGNNVGEDGNCTLWLRSMGIDQESALIINKYHKLMSSAVGSDNVFVRLALWIKQ